jgi:hypothetical protein
MALVMGHEIVGNHLRSPSTASFGGWFDDNENSADRHVTVRNDGQYIVTGWVDAQNGYGAIARANFWVKIRYEPETDTWYLVEGPDLIPR